MTEQHISEIKEQKIYIIEAIQEASNNSGQCRHPRVDTVRIIAIDLPFVACKTLFQERIILRFENFKWFEPSDRFVEVVND